MRVDEAVVGLHKWLGGNARLFAQRRQGRVESL